MFLQPSVSCTSLSPVQTVEERSAFMNSCLTGTTCVPTEQCLMYRMSSCPFFCLQERHTELPARLSPFCNFWGVCKSCSARAKHAAESSLAAFRDYLQILTGVCNTCLMFHLCNIDDRKNPNAEIRMGICNTRPM